MLVSCGDGDDPSVPPTRCRAHRGVVAGGGAAVFDRVHGDWRTSQAAAVTHALERHETRVSVEREVVTGFVSVRFDAAEKPGEIHMIALDPPYQRRGTAATLTEHALSEMRRRDLDLAAVATGGDPGHAAARATYQRAGFVACPHVWYAKCID